MVDGVSADLPFEALPPDDSGRKLVVADPDSPKQPHISLAGDIDTVLVSGEDSGGRYRLIDMHVPPSGGPPPHRHDFEKIFTLRDDTLELVFRGETSTISSGSTVNILMNAPHSFKNVSGIAARMLCMCTPPGQLGRFDRHAEQPEPLAECYGVYP